MRKFRIYVVEDMAFTRAALITLLEESNFDVVGSAANAEKAWEELSIISVDLVLLDINLAGEKNGIWLAQVIRQNLQVPIVFLTAYGDDKTLADLKGIHPNGYLMKPYNKPTLITTINIAISSFQTVLNSIPIDKFVIINDGFEKIKIALHHINFIVSEANYINIYLDDKKYLVRDKLTNFLENIPENNFIFRTHLRYAINTSKIQELSVNGVTINEVTIPVSKTYKSKIANLYR